MFTRSNYERGASFAGRSWRSRLLAGDPVLVAIEATVVRHRQLVELRAAPDVRDRRTARVISRAKSPETVRVPLVQVGAVLVERGGAAATPPRAALAGLGSSAATAVARSRYIRLS